MALFDPSTPAFATPSPHFDAQTPEDTELIDTAVKDAFGVDLINAGDGMKGLLRLCLASIVNNYDDLKELVASDSILWDNPLFTQTSQRPRKKRPDTWIIS